MLPEDFIVYQWRRRGGALGARAIPFMPELYRSRLLHIKFTPYLKIQRTQNTLFISGFSLLFACKLCFVIARNKEVWTSGLCTTAYAIYTTPMSRGLDFLQPRLWKARVQAVWSWYCLYLCTERHVVTEKVYIGLT